MKSLFKRKSSKHISNDQHIGQPPEGGFNITTISEDDPIKTSKYDASFEIKPTNNLASPSIDQQPAIEQAMKTRRLSFKRHILGNNTQTTSNSILPPLPSSNNSATSPRTTTKVSPRPSTTPVPCMAKKSQPAHSLTLQLEDLLATSYKTRQVPFQKFVFLVDFSFMETEELYNIVKKAYISFIHAKNQSSWNFSNDSGSENITDSNIVTLSIMGMNRSSVIPVWSSENEKLIDPHQRQGFIKLDDPNLKRSSSYLLGVKQVLDCCEYLNSNANFVMNSNPYEENQDIINLDILTQYILQNLHLSDVNIVSSFIEKDRTRFSISHQLLHELEKLVCNSSCSLHVDILKITSRYDLGVLAIPTTSSNKLNSETVLNERVIFSTLDKFLERVRSKKSRGFTFSIGIGKSDLVKTNKELETNLSKCFSLFTVNPKLRTNSISFYEESAITNPLSDYVYHL